MANTTTNPHVTLIQVDLDGLNSVLDCYGCEMPNSELDTIYLDGVNRLLDLMAEFELKGTFFVIGKDCEDKGKRAVVERLLKEGHELGNHTYSHPLSFGRMPRHLQEEEIDKCSSVIQELTGKPPVGFRAPGFAITGSAVSCLEERGYLYDASIFPCSLSWAVRAWQSLTSPSVYEKEKYGAIEHSKSPIHPYFPDKTKIQVESKERRSILEIPVSTYPLLRFPFHGSYLMVLAKFSSRIAIWYWNLAYKWYVRNGLPYVFVIHPLELTKMTNDPRLKAQLGYDNAIETKVALIRRVFSIIAKNSTALKTSDYARNRIAAN